MNEMRLVNGQSNGSVQAATYSDKFSGYSDIPYPRYLMGNGSIGHFVN